MSNHQYTAKDIFAMSPIIPVVVVHKLDHILPLAEAIYASGIKIIEITLRTPIALEAISLVKDNFDDMVVGAGTVLNDIHIQQAMEAGAMFAISPGLSSRLLQNKPKLSLPLIPGVATISELMSGLEAGFECFKFFPAQSNGGVQALKAIYGPFPDIKFCPTGGINQENYQAYLNLPNVACVGGSWMIPEKHLTEQNWQQISMLCQHAFRGC